MPTVHGEGGPGAGNCSCWVELLPLLVLFDVNSQKRVRSFFSTLIKMIHVGLTGVEYI